MTVAEAIEVLKKQPQDVPLYFDCPHCGMGNLMGTPTHAVVIKTKKESP